MARFPKPAEGSWTEHYRARNGAVVVRGLDLARVLRARAGGDLQAAWLNVGRVEQLPRTGSYFTKELAAAEHVGHRRARHATARSVRSTTSAGTAATSSCGTTIPREETQGICRQFTCKYHGWRYDLDGALTFVQQEGEFFDLDKSSSDSSPVHCDVWAGFIFVNFAPRARAVAARVPRPDGHRARGLPVRADDVSGSATAPTIERELEAVHGRVRGVLPRTCPAREAVTGQVLGRRAQKSVSRRRTTSIEGPHRLVSTSGVRYWEMDDDAVKPIGGPDAQRPVRPVGQARPRARCRPA